MITNFPIWLSETADVPALALPDEPPGSVVDLARSFSGTRLLVVEGTEHRHWPADLDAGSPGSECFREVDLPPLPTSGGARSGLRIDPLTDTRVWEIVCP